MTARRIIVAVLALASLHDRYPRAGRRRWRAGAGGRAGGGRGGGGGGRRRRLSQALVTGAWGEQSLTPDSRGWGWMVKPYVGKAQRPLWNQAKEKLLNDGKVTSVTISSFNPEILRSAEALGLRLVRDAARTMSLDEVQKMIAACPGREGAAPMIRMPDALEANIQKATDLGVIGIIFPTVDDALEARDAARFSRYPPFGRRSSGRNTAGAFW